MKLLIVTQTVDVNDPVLGFFVRWIQEFAKHAESIEVICLKEGEHALPNNVRVHSLGKERGVSKAMYLLHFYRYIWQLRHSYDAVFVHMNQEYVLLAGWFWKLAGKNIFMWRNHYTGSFLTDIAVVFCTKVFCTSKYSYTAKYKKTVFMPVGVDITLFTQDARTLRKPNSILFLSRMSPSKRPRILIDALIELSKKNISFSTDVYGSPLSKDEAFYEGLKTYTQSLGLSDRVLFMPGISNTDTMAIYRKHEIFVNASPSGMFDKTIFEAAASGCVVLTTNEDIRDALGDEYYFSDAKMLAEKLETLLQGHANTQLLRERLKVFIKQHSLSRLGDSLEEAMRL